MLLLMLMDQSIAQAGEINKTKYSVFSRDKVTTNNMFAGNYRPLEDFERGFIAYDSVFTCIEKKYGSKLSKDEAKLGANYKVDRLSESQWVFTRELEHAGVLVDLENRTEITDWDSGPLEDTLLASGPAAIREELSGSGVFTAPGVYPTDEYDALKVYPNLQGLFFEGLPYHGNPTRVFCWYGVPEGIEPGQKLPAVVLLHGGGGNVYPEWVKKWNDQGYIAISLALEGQLPGIRNTSLPEPYYPVHDFSGPYRQGFFNDLENESLQDQWFYHAVADAIIANSLLRSFPEVDSTKIGLTGISWGGILANVVAGLDDRFAFIIPVYGCGYLHETPTYSTMLGRLNPDAQSFYLENWEPSLYIPFHAAPTLFVNGTNDCHFSMNSFTKTYESSPNEKYLRVEHNMLHGHAPGWTPNSIYAFADYVVRGGSKPFLVYSIELTARGEATFSYEGDIAKAEIYATTDTADWSCDKYEWTKIPAVIDSEDKIIKGNLPWGTKYYFVNGTSSTGVMFSSPMQISAFPIELSDDDVLQRDPQEALDSEVQSSKKYLRNRNHI